MASGPKIFLCIHYQVQEWYQVPGNFYINGAIMFIYKWCQVHVYGTSMFLIHGMRCQHASIYMVPGCFYIHGAKMFLYTWCQDVSIYMVLGCFYIHGARMFLYTIHGARMFLYTWCQDVSIYMVLGLDINMSC